MLIVLHSILLLLLTPFFQNDLFIFLLKNIYAFVSCRGTAALANQVEKHCLFSIY